MSEPCFLEVLVERTGRQAVGLSNYFLLIYFKKAGQVLRLCVALVIVARSLFNDMDVRVYDSVDLLSLIVNQILSGAEVALLKSFVGRSVSQEQVISYALWVCGVKGLLQFLLLLFFQNRFLSARLDFECKN